MVHIVLKLTGLRLQLVTLHTFLSNLPLQLLLSLVNSLNPLVSILLELFDLVLKSLLVFLILLLMFSLDNFLSLLSDSVKLNILGSLLEISNFEIKSLLYVSDPLQICFEL